ncbi:uncharacterized protein MYCFIDRAFT_81079 [Pseudocercospora fijiensis CIRAD86]|uniref:Prion-inhibition and propagation HeLo domain-containing protein n=1 Tax=Pseudocercospora fijiensis (strain CIRAD86) TaxID=383855 RepID=M3A4Q5_PSEFD|nr:uncharacterized protein MYCFIDRAFT_81079 [Pseudocercospora fijiensis CIRAD86]EME79591.1 hypothetical protein MYCFIDRAFT_81079 [Pseudocercospora fijiensis CIRAD86]
MAEGTLALSIPGWFLTGVTYFKLVRCAGDFKEDFALLWLKFESVQLRFTRWGLAARIPAAPVTEVSTKQWADEFVTKYSPEQVKWAESVLRRVTKAFKRVYDKVDDDTEEIALQTKGLALALEEVNEEEALDRTPKLAAVHRFFKKASEKGHKFVDSGRLLKDRTKWALHKKDYLVQLVNLIADLVLELETQFPDIAEEAKKLAAAEVQEAAGVSEPREEVLNGVAQVSEGTDPALTEAIKAVVRTTISFDFSGLGLSEKAVGHYGANFDRVPEGANITLTARDINAGGDTRTHIGHTFGNQGRVFDTKPGATAEK